MELNSNVVNALKCFTGSTEGNASKIDERAFRTIIEQVFDAFFLNNKNGNFEINLEKNKLENLGIPKCELKDGLATLFTLISESAKIDLDSNSLSTFLEDIGFTNERIKIFQENYEKKMPVIRLFLSSSSFSYPHIVDVNWRLDYSIKENNLERLNEPVYLIELKLETPNKKGLTSLQFYCTIEQLQDFVLKLREATKSLEKLAQV